MLSKRDISSQLSWAAAAAAASAAAAAAAAAVAARGWTVGALAGKDRAGQRMGIG